MSHTATFAAFVLMVAFAATSCSGARAAPEVSTGCALGRRVALTFDDGPNPPFTGAILDVLADKGVTATFFVEGSMATQHPELVRRAASLGMAIGSHSNEHLEDYPQQSADAFGADLSAAEHAILLAAGSRPALYRAPYGHWSPTMYRVLRARGYTPIGWDLDSQDWDPSVAADTIERTVLDRAHPGAIILMHDGGLGGGDPDRSRTVAALPLIIDGLRGRGYEIVPLAELLSAPGATNADGATRC